MKMYSFKVNHFRCLYDTDWITMHAPTVLIGCNDGGKTATVDALTHFFLDVPIPDNAYAYVPNAPLDASGNRPRENEILIEAKFCPNPQELAHLQEVLPVPPEQCLHLRKVFRRDITKTSFDMLMQVPQNPDVPPDPNALSINETRLVLYTFAIPNPQGTQREPLLEALKQWLRQQPMKQSWATAPDVVLDLLPVYQVVEVKDPESTVFQMLNNTHRQLLKQPDTQQLLGNFRAQIDSRLRQPLVQKTADLTTYISRYLPDIQLAYVTPQFDINATLKSAPLTLVGKDGNPIDLSARGAGTRQQVTLAVFQWNAETIASANEQPTGDTIIAFDEPDLHLDYQAQRRIYEAIETYVAKDVQVIVATHSINLINRVPIQYIYHYSKPTDSSRVTIETLSPSIDEPGEVDFFINKIGEAMGLDNASMFYERCFLAFEGPTEQAALPRLFFVHTNGDQLNRKGIKLVNCFSDYGAIVFAKFMHRNKRPVLFMVDEDTTINKGAKRSLSKSDLEKAGFSIEKQVHFVGPSCFEYAFPNEVWAKVLNTQQPNKKSDWTPEEIQPLRTNPKEFIKSIYGLLEEESKPRIGIMLSRAVGKPEEIPSGIRSCFDNAIDIANR